MITQYLRDLTTMLGSSKLKSSKLYHFTSTDPERKVNSALLAGCYLLIIEKRSPEEINSLFTSQTEFVSYCDASTPKSDFQLTFLDCLRGLQRAVLLGCSVETGGFNWIIPNKILAFICPAQDSSGRDGVKPLTPEEFSPIFQSLGVKTIIRLNKKNYEKERFTRNGFDFHDLYFIDGSVPAGQIVKDFLQICEKDDQVVAVHCKAGLGRTGTLIGCYVMKHFAFSALEFIAWARFARPGSVLGPQQQFLVDIERICWRWGEKFRSGDQDDSLEVKEIDEIRPDREAKFGDYRQAERLNAGSVVKGSKGNAGTINKWKIAKKQVFNKNK